MFFILGGVSGCPLHLYAPICSYAPCMFIHSPGVYTPPICSPYSSVHLYVFRSFACCGGGCKGLPFVLGHFPYTTPVWGCLPFICTPTLSCGFPVHWYVLGISIYCVGIFPSVEGFGGVPPISWGVWGHQHLRWPYAHSCIFL